MAELRCGPVWFRWQIQDYQARSGAWAGAAGTARGRTAGVTATFAHAYPDGRTANAPARQVDHDLRPLPLLLPAEERLALPSRKKRARRAGNRVARTRRQPTGGDEREAAPERFV